MAGKRILVTGGTGFLGHHLVPALLGERYRVRLLVRPSSDLSWLPRAGVEHVQADVTDFGAVRQAMAGCTHVVHAAGRFRFWGSEARFQAVNVSGTENVARAAGEHGVERLVHISTVAVIGDPPPGRLIDEQTPCQPRDAYQRSKLAAEQLVYRQIDHHALPAVILRPGAFYGPYGRYGFNRLFIEDPLRGLRVQVDGGRRLVFPVFVPDVAWSIRQALDADIPIGETYNICDEPVSHAEINQIVSDLLGISRWRLNTPRQLMLLMAGLMELWARFSGREPFYPLNLRSYVFNDWPVTSAKASRALGFRPTPLEHGLRQTVAWYQDLPGAVR